ncbi:MAG: chromosomal replication initiator protein DnaA, partial [Clostridia bacterium]
STQEEFFHTFNHLHASGKQIVISSDRPPKDIPTLEERLRSRFEWGLVADIQKPDYETRVAILRKKANTEHMEVPDEVLNFIAEKVDSNIRELEGSLTRVNAKAMIDNVPVSLPMAELSLSNLVGVRDAKRITHDRVMQVVEDYYRVDNVDLTNQRRNREISLPRQVAMYLTRELTNLSTTRIGEAFGGRDHTTVMHGCSKIADSVKQLPHMAKTLDELREAIRDQRPS